jgi:uncharacterized membrane protein
MEQVPALGRCKENRMTQNSWLLLAILLLVPSLIVGFLRLVLKKEASAVSGIGGVVFALMTFALSMWIILDKVS